MFMLHEYSLQILPLLLSVSQYWKRIVSKISLRTRTLRNNTFQANIVWFYLGNESKVFSESTYVNIFIVT